MSDATTNPATAANLPLASVQMAQAGPDHPKLVTLEFDGLLFDMDGTLVDSSAGVEGLWQLFRKEHPELTFTPAHGLRTQDIVRKTQPHLTAEEVKAQADRYELEIIELGQRKVDAGLAKLAVSPCPGVIENIVPALSQNLGEDQGWALCTSATGAYATRAMEIAGIPKPRVFVDSYAVENGKPAPDPYLEGAKRLGLDPTKCLVFEDATAGVLSGHAAGCKVLAVMFTTARKQLGWPDILLDTLEDVKLERKDKKWLVTVPWDSILIG